MYWLATTAATEKLIHGSKSALGLRLASVLLDDRHGARTT
jgi:hypothetical protein